jgi:hypothetical protein
LKAFLWCREIIAAETPTLRAKHERYYSVLYRM